VVLEEEGFRERLIELRRSFGVGKRYEERVSGKVRGEYFSLEYGGQKNRENNMKKLLLAGILISCSFSTWAQCVKVAHPAVNLSTYYAAANGLEGQALKQASKRN